MEQVQQLRNILLGYSISIVPSGIIKHGWKIPELNGGFWLGKSPISMANVPYKTSIHRGFSIYQPWSWWHRGAPMKSSHRHAIATHRPPGPPESHRSLPDPGGSTHALGPSMGHTEIFINMSNGWTIWKISILFNLQIVAFNLWNLTMVTSYKNSMPWEWHSSTAVTKCRHSNLYTKISLGRSISQPLLSLLMPTSHLPFKVQYGSISLTSNGRCQAATSKSLHRIP